MATKTPPEFDISMCEKCPNQGDCAAGALYKQVEMGVAPKLHELFDENEEATIDQVLKGAEGNAFDGIHKGLDALQELTQSTIKALGVAIHQSVIVVREPFGSAKLNTEAIAENLVDARFEEFVPDVGIPLSETLEAAARDALDHSRSNAKCPALDI